MIYYLLLILYNNMTEIILNYNGNLTNIPFNIKSVTTLLEFISSKYEINQEKVKELELFYNCDEKRVEIKNNLDLARAYFHLRQETEIGKKMIFVYLPVDNLSYFKNKILEKEAQLKDILEKEKSERERININKEDNKLSAEIEEKIISEREMINNMINNQNNLPID